MRLRRGHHDSGPEGIEAVGPLQEEDEDEEHSAASEAVDGIGGTGTGKEPVLEEAKIHHGLRCLPFPYEEGSQAEEGKGKETIDVDLVDERKGHQGSGQEQRAQTKCEGKAARPVEALQRRQGDGLAKPQDAPDGSGSAQRHIDQED